MLRARHAVILFAVAGLFIALSSSNLHAQTSEVKQHFEKDGLAFDYGAKWELSDQSNGDAQQLVLTEKTLDGQIMIVALRAVLTNPKQEEDAKRAVVEPGINRLLTQYATAGIQVDRTPVRIELSGTQAEGAQLRFNVDGFPGTTDVAWAVINQRLVQLFFIRPEKTATETAVCWEAIRNSLRIAKPGNPRQ